jgi:hypothetical protein
MTKVVPTEKQKKEKNRFAQTVAYAKAILADPIQKQAVASRTTLGKLVYHQAIKEYMELNRV